MVIRLKSSRPGAIRLDVMLNRYPFTDAKAPDDRRPGKYVSAGVWPATRCDRLYTLDGNRIIMEGHEAETRFAVGVSAATDGRIEDCYSRLIIREAQEVVLLVTAATDNREKDCPAAVKKGLDLSLIHISYRISLRGQSIWNYYFPVPSDIGKHQGRKSAADEFLCFFPAGGD